VNSFSITECCASGAKVNIVELLEMSTDSYWHKTPNGEVIRIGVSPTDVSRWAIWLRSILVDDNFGSAGDAGFFAHRKDFLMNRP